MCGWTDYLMFWVYLAFSGRLEGLTSMFGYAYAHTRSLCFMCTNFKACSEGTCRPQSGITLSKSCAVFSPRGTQNDAETAPLGFGAPRPIGFRGKLALERRASAHVRLLEQREGWIPPVLLASLLWGCSLFFSGASYSHGSKVAMFAVALRSFRYLAQTR